MKALIIKENWLNLILSGKKTWEIRSSNTKKVGQKIGLIQSGSGKIYGECTIINSMPVKKEILYKNISKHQVSKEDINKLNYKHPHAWVLADVKKYKSPKNYKHLQGAVIWVNC